MSVTADMVFANAQGDCETVEALVKALVGDGFTSRVVGRKDTPTALIATYEWPEHELVDMVVTPLGGPAVAARLTRGQWETALWTWIGSPLPAIWALLNLPHPDHSDAPHQVVEAPAVLRLAEQVPLTVRTPDAGKIGARARRLSRERHHEEMSKTFVAVFFDYIDEHRSGVGLAGLFAEDGVLRMPGFPPMVGQTAIALFVNSLFDEIAGVEHRINRFWHHEEDSTAVVEGVVTFTRHDGSKLVEPFTVIVDFTHDDDERLLVTRWSVYADYHKLHPDASVESPQDCKAVILTG
jgi:SnoaL-like protein